MNQGWLAVKEKWFELQNKRRWAILRLIKATESKESRMFHRWQTYNFQMNII